MRTAGIREARQYLTELIDEVRKGREVVITDRGHPVARLAAPSPEASRPFRSRSAFRRAMPLLDPPISSNIEEDREDRI